MSSASKKKGLGRGLGKGLGAIIPQGTVFTGGRTIVNLDITKLVPNPRQPRQTFDKDALQDLANSIKEQGVITPVLARMKDGKYELVAGERRLRAAKMAGLSNIPTIIKSFSDEQSMEIALIENLQREDLNPIEEAEGYLRLAEEFKMTQESIAKRVGKNRVTITNTIRLLGLPSQIKDSLRKDEITAGHARALLSIDDPKQQMTTWKQIITSKLNVRDVEMQATVRSDKSKAKKATGRKRAFTQNVELNALVEKLTTHLGTKVKILGTPERGRIEVEYYSREDLGRILDMIMKQEAEGDVYVAQTPEPEPTV